MYGCDPYRESWVKQRLLIDWLANAKISLGNFLGGSLQLCEEKCHCSLLSSWQKGLSNEPNSRLAKLSPPDFVSRQFRPGGVRTSSKDMGGLPSWTPHDGLRPQQAGCLARTPCYTQGGCGSCRFACLVPEPLHSETTLPRRSAESGIGTR